MVIWKGLSYRNITTKLDSQTEKKMFYKMETGILRDLWGLRLYKGLPKL